ncbi:hypothetical protein JS528_05195 [Bifidobacterium sp. MA2]|uniref:DNA-binding response regulator n=1 Tax=Bifidobacterium santillanense TaxID=2809028 RepID=A0ABS5UPF4_9BIFI|nr:LuxR C-terminal-related transcriptional regulator [Bifidobacterium santillanense]MBT1172757.1 hypothetical protein [Bifidobacterium santillanense]
MAVLDNDLLSLKMFRMLLQRHGAFDFLWDTRFPAVAVQSCIDRVSRPDVLLVDMALDGTTGIDVCHRIRQAVPDVRFVGVTAYDPAPYDDREHRDDLYAIVRKDDFTGLPRTIVDAYRAGSLASPDDDASDDATRHELSPRELEVLGHYADGRTTREIMDLMGLSKSTLWSYESRALSKLGARNRIEAVAKCVRLHLLP